MHARTHARHAHARTLTNKHTHKNTHKHARTHTHGVWGILNFKTHTHTHTHTRTQTRTHAHAQTCTQTHAHMYTCGESVVRRSPLSLYEVSFVSILGLFCLYTRSLLTLAHKHPHTYMCTTQVL